MNKSDNLSIVELSELTEESIETNEKDQLKKEKEEARMLMLATSGPGKWNILQEYLIEIEADCKLKEGLGQKFPTYVELLKLLEKKVELEHSEDEATKKALLTCIPKTKGSVYQWHHLSGWEDAVIEKMKSYGLFTPDKRAQVIEALRQRATTDGDTQAAKIWLTMSGDYSDKIDVKDTKFEKYKEYVSSLKSSKIINNDDK